MFNRQPFNRGEFNASFSTVPEAAGVANMALSGSVVGVLAIQTSESTAVMNLGLSANPTRNIEPPTTLVRFALNSAGRSRARLFGNPETAKLEFAINADMTRRIFLDVLADLVLEIDGINTRKLNANSLVTRLILALTAQSSQVIRAVSPPIPLVLNASGAGLRTLLAGLPEADLSLNATGEAEMFGYASLDLDGLVLPVGGDLIIDTGEMTVTLNGQDVTRYVGRNSEFFKLRPGDNVIVYEDGVQNRNISYNILWKDLWL